MLPFNSSTPTDILITNTHTNIEQISDGDKAHCQLMIHPNSGYDNLTAELVASVDFPIVIGNPIRAQAVTNFILSALLSHYSPVPHVTSWDKTRKWPRLLLAELNILVIGMGHIGSLLKNSLIPLANTVNVYDPYQHHTDLDLKNIDVVIPACSLNVKNLHMINREFLLQLKDDFLLINAARGDLVNTEELIEVLKLRPRAFAILDVFEKEPCDFSLFSSLTNISLSSHIAGVYANIDQVTANFVARVIADFSELSPEEFDQLYESMLLKNRLHADGFLI
jgi:D-3-phosphoglycerate dehydrogenase